MSSRNERPAIRWNAVCVDCSIAGFAAMLNFYQQLLGFEVRAGCGEPSECDHTDGHWVALRDPEGGVAINIQTEHWYAPPVWPEQPNGLTKMLHFEIRVDDVEAAVAYAVTIGAREAPQQPEDRDPAALRVMLDPAGHPFCLWS
jgi:catechol 2,3-dioxygenase-like lactoylglutathione lyase family enzyme